MKKIMFNDKFLLTKSVLDGRKTQTRRIVSQGKISNEGKSYCYVTVFKVNGMEYKVVANDKTKSTMFYVRRDKK